MWVWAGLVQEEKNRQLGSGKCLSLTRADQKKYIIGPDPNPQEPGNPISLYLYSWYVLELAVVARKDAEQEA